jgi:hypothetical protein
MAPLAPYVPSFIKQIVTWTFFLGVYVVAWNMAIVGGVQKMDDQLDTGLGFRRPYIVALGAYVFVVALFNIAAISLVSYCACTLLCMTATFAPKWWQCFIVSFALPSTVFNCISLHHIKIHAVMFLATIAAFSIMAWMYVEDEDMRPASTGRVRDKIMRMLMIIPGGVLMIGYGMYAVYSTFTAHDLITRMDQLFIPVPKPRKNGKPAKIPPCEEAKKNLTDTWKKTFG